VVLCQKINAEDWFRNSHQNERIQKCLETEGELPGDFSPRGNSAAICSRAPETVMLERRKQASACLNHMTGSDVQNSGNFTPTALTLTAASATLTFGVGTDCITAATACWICRLITC
jgi:hypothetical protein